MRPLEGRVIQMKGGGTIYVMVKADVSAAIRDDLKITKMETGTVLIDPACDLIRRRSPQVLVLFLTIRGEWM